MKLFKHSGSSDVYLLTINGKKYYKKTIFRKKEEKYKRETKIIDILSKYTYTFI